MSGNLAKKVMKAVLVRKFGGPDACEIATDVPIPEPNENQIQIKVIAAGINPVDTYIRSGTHSRKPQLPYTPGGDSAGIISKLGANVKNFNVGDRVYTFESASGTYAEYALSTAKYTFKLPDTLTFDEGSALGVPYFTAYRALFIKGNAKPGETVLIHGASGSVGIACIQLAKAHGMKIIGTAGSDAGLKLIKSQGVDVTFNHREAGYFENMQKLYPDGVELIVEMLANVNLNNDIQFLRFRKGRVMVVGNRGAIEVNPRFLMAKETSICGVTLFSSDEDEINIMSSHINGLIQLNCIKPVTGKTYSIDETAKAHNDVINNEGSTGRLTLSIQSA